MRKKRPAEDMAAKLHQMDFLVAQGTPLVDATAPSGSLKAGRDRKLATPLQQRASACLAELQTSSSKGVRVDLRGLAGCATPTGCAARPPCAG